MGKSLTNIIAGAVLSLNLLTGIGHSQNVTKYGGLMSFLGKYFNAVCEGNKRAYLDLYTEEAKPTYESGFEQNQKYCKYKEYPEILESGLLLKEKFPKLPTDMFITFAKDENPNYYIYFIFIKEKGEWKIRMSKLLNELQYRSALAELRALIGK